MRKQRSTGAFQITGARTGLSEDVRGRQRRYVISMAVRTVAVVLSVVLWNVERPIAIAALVLGLGLPYIAVVIANAGRENVPSFPSTFVAAPTRPALPAGGPDDRAESGVKPAEAGAADPGRDRG
ncbi:DUF3099 domain-containing protein [Streptomyces celluloflavus]|uniref:DUF3099 domain-containing protein n=1 Tax=Streptomyces celluloflavus TaxID=58344 RepID=UPI00364C70AB